MTTDATLVVDADLTVTVDVAVVGGSGGGGIDTTGTITANDYARFTDSDTVEGRSASEVRTDLGLDYTTLDERTRDTIGTALVAGTNVTITVNDAGDTITIAAAGGGATNLTWTASTSTVASDTGTDAVLTAADGSNAGLMTSAQFTKLAGISTSANKVAVAVYSAGWPARPTADIVVWTANGDTAATTPGAAVGDDIVILAQDADLTAIAALTSAANKVPYSTGAQTWALADFTAAGRALVDDADATAQRATLGLVIGTNVQAQDTELAAIAGLTSAADRLPYFTGSGTAALATFTAAGRALVDDADTAAQLVTLGAVAQAQTVNAQTGTTYTLVLADAGKLVSLSNAAAITLTLPQDTDVAIAVGTYVDFYQLGAGQVTVVAGTGATLRTSGLTAKARAQYSRFSAQKVSANTWSLFGDLAAS
jgi:hypothetical protein